MSIRFVPVGSPLERCIDLAAFQLYGIWAKRERNEARGRRFFFGYLLQPCYLLNYINGAVCVFSSLLQSCTAAHKHHRKTIFGKIASAD